MLYAFRGDRCPTCGWDRALKESLSQDARRWQKFRSMSMTERYEFLGSAPLLTDKTNPFSMGTPAQQAIMLDEHMDHQKKNG